jgi:hypothetical protein
MSRYKIHHQLIEVCDGDVMRCIMSENGAEFKNDQLDVHNDEHMVGQHIKYGCECSTSR